MRLGAAETLCPISTALMGCISHGVGLELMVTAWRVELSHHVGVCGSV